MTAHAPDLAAIAEQLRAIAEQLDPRRDATRHRSAITGHYVTEAEAAANPDTTIREARKV